MLENVVFDPAERIPDFDSDAITENTRIAYPLDFIPGAEPTGRGGSAEDNSVSHLRRLRRAAAAREARHRRRRNTFLSGYTAKLAGTEQGVTLADGDV